MTTNPSWDRALAIVGWECISPKANIPPWMKNATARVVVVVGVKVLIGIWKLSFSMELGMKVSVIFTSSGDSSLPPRWWWLAATAALFTVWQLPIVTESIGKRRIT